MKIETGFGVDIEVNYEEAHVKVYNSFSGETKIIQGLQNIKKGENLFKKIERGED